MKANELRIGNYVNEWWSTDKKYYVKKLDIDLLRCIIEDWTECEPIPLTEEWLLKFGFDTMDCEVDLMEYAIDKNGTIIFSIFNDGGIYDHDKNPFYIESEGEKNNFTHTHKIEILYVHQLQNLYFALTGEELTIKE